MKLFKTDFSEAEWGTYTTFYFQIAKRNLQPADLHGIMERAKAVSKLAREGLEDANFDLSVEYYPARVPEGYVDEAWEGDEAGSVNEHDDGDSEGLDSNHDAYEHVADTDDDDDDLDSIIVGDERALASDAYETDGADDEHEDEDDEQAEGEDNEQEDEEDNVNNEHDEGEGFDGFAHDYYDSGVENSVQMALREFNADISFSMDLDLDEV